MPLEIHIGGPASAPLARQVAFIRRAEALGFDGVGIADNVQHGHDVYVALALAAAQTSTIQLYPAITNPVTRHPFVLASLANSLAELAPGRVKLAIGPGDTGVIQAGLKPATINELREAVQAIRRLLRGDAVRFGGGEERRLREPITPAPPVAVAASGPRALELAAEVGDEALLTVGLDPRIIQAVALHLARGAEKAGRSIGDLPVTYYTIVSIDPDGAVARERVYPTLLQWLGQGMFRVGLDALGIESPGRSPQAAQPDALARLCGLLSIAGTPGEVREQFDRLASNGVRRVFCMALGDEASHGRVMELLAQHVLAGAR